ncbi:hypothetical protein CRUP_022100, partial [Coryphaenoides rupestris]
SSSSSSIGPPATFLRGGGGGALPGGSVRGGSGGPGERPLPLPRRPKWAAEPPGGAADQQPDVAVRDAAGEGEEGDVVCGRRRGGGHGRRHGPRRPHPAALQELPPAQRRPLCGRHQGGQFDEGLFLQAAHQQAQPHLPGPQPRVCLPVQLPERGGEPGVGADLHQPHLQLLPGHAAVLLGVPGPLPGLLPAAPNGLPPAGGPAGGPAGAPRRRRPAAGPHRRTGPAGAAGPAHGH